MIKQIIMNNIISVLIHTGFCLLSYFLFYILGRYVNSIITFVIYVFSAVAIPLLYFLCGRLLLVTTQNVPYNIYSVAALSVILTVCMFVSWNIPNLFITNASFYPFSLFLGFLPSFIGTLVLALLPSATFYIGLITQNTI